MTASAFGRVLIKPTKPAGNGVWFELTGEVERTGGVGGWEGIDRPRRTTATEWVRTPAVMMTIPLLLDGIEVSIGRDASVEANIRRLESWGKPTKKTKQPPILSVAGPMRGAGGRWVLQDITWGSAQRNNKGRIVQQEVSVVLQQYIEAKVVRSPAAASRRRRR